MINHPRLLSAVLLVAMWLLALAGTKLRSINQTTAEDEAEGSVLVISATLTLLGLIIGFTFSMASTRYDLRRQYEEAEANAIGTEWVRCDLLPSDESTRTRALLREYLQARIAFYSSDYGGGLALMRQEVAGLQNKLWASVLPSAVHEPTPEIALVVSGMNDVLNSQGYTQAAWRNRIPVTAWALLIIIACVANLLVGYGTQQKRSRTLLLIVLPVLVSVAIFLIADIDSPRGGVIRINPVNLLSLQQSL